MSYSCVILSQTAAGDIVRSDTETAIRLVGYELTLHN